MTKVAFLGLKGLPPRFGGLQFDAENIAIYLLKKKVEVLVYCRKWYQGNYNKETYKQIRLKTFKTLKFNSTLDVITHSLLSVLHARFYEKVDVVYLFSYGSYFTLVLLKIFGIKSIVRFNGNPTHSSYNPTQKLFSKYLIKLSLLTSKIITAESHPIAESLDPGKSRRIHITPVTVPKALPHEIDITKKFLIKKDRFFLYIGRIVKGKKIETILEAFNKIQEYKDFKLIIAGPPNDEDYFSYLCKMVNDNPNIIFVGEVRGQLKSELLTNCRSTILASESEGLPTSIVESFSYGKESILSDIDAHKWIYNSTGLCQLFKLNDIGSLFEKIKLQMGTNPRAKDEVILKSAKIFSEDKVNNQIYKLIVENE